MKELSRFWTRLYAHPATSYLLSSVIKNSHDTSYLEREVGRSRFKASSGKKLARPYVIKQVMHDVTHLYHSYSGGRGKRIMVQGWPGKM
jgi:hypothetical protein